MNAVNGSNGAPPPIEPKTPAASARSARSGLWFALACAAHGRALELRLQLGPAHDASIALLQALRELLNLEDVSYRGPEQAKVLYEMAEPSFASPFASR